MHAGRECLGYKVPRPWIFEGLKDTAPQNRPETVEDLCRSDAETTNETVKPDPDLSKQDTQQCLSLTASVVPFIGDTPEERRAMKFWLCETAQTLANYGPRFDFWSNVVPMWAVQSDVLRHLLVSTTLVDEQLGFYRPATTSNLSPAAIWHYHAAIKKMASDQEPNMFVLTLASLLGWVFETLQRNHTAGLIHIRAASRLLTEVEGSLPSQNSSMGHLVALLKPMLRLGLSYMDAVFKDVASQDDRPADEEVVARDVLQDIPVIGSLSQATALLLDSTERYVLSPQIKHAASRQRQYMVRWHNAIRQYCSKSLQESHLYKMVAQLLFNFGLAFLPESEVGTFSCQAGPQAITHLLAAMERIATKTQNDNFREDNQAIKETLVNALDLLMRHVRLDHFYARAVYLRDELTGRSSKPRALLDADECRDRADLPAGP